MGILYLIATPIGNLGDFTPRAREIFSTLDVLACEDTRHTGNLIKLLELPKPPQLLANHEYNERGMAARITALLDEGKTVGLCSDAGYPLVSDPGYPAVVTAIQAGHQIIAIPGASAAPLALLISGLPPSSYIFKGFPPRKPGARKNFLQEDADARHTLIFYESPFRIPKFLEEALEVLGDRQAAVCLELTKQFERVSRGTLSQLVAEYRDKKIKGEGVIVIAGKDKGNRDKEDEMEVKNDEP